MPRPATDRDLLRSHHQKLCPMLKKKLKWPAWPTCGLGAVSAVV
jgi:hypothetical protein